MSAIGQLFRTLFTLLGIDPTPKVMAPIAAVLLVLLWPTLKANRAIKKARNLLSSAPLRSRPERERLSAEALALVAGNVMGLVVVAEEAIRAGLKDTAQTAIVQLEASGKRPQDVRRLRRELDPAAPVSALLEVAAIEGMRAEGLSVLADERLERALARWPEHEGLLALRVAPEEPVV